MKKAYAKVKSSKAKSTFMRPYIAATIIGAAVCAIVLSQTIGKSGDDTTNLTKLSAPITQSLTKKPDAESKTSPPSTPQPAPKTEVPSTPTTEVNLPSATPEISAPDPDVPSSADNQEDVSVGLFSGGKAPEFSYPVGGNIFRKYSDTKPVKSETLGTWQMHTGIDIEAPAGANVTSPADGIILSAEKHALTGHTIKIDHGNKVVSIIYNLEQSDNVTVGQKVKAGEIIGTVGSSAPLELSDAPHVHFEVQIDGKYVNPQDYIK